MKKESIKKHLKKYSIFQKRKTTINHAFASAIAPAEKYDEIILIKALKLLGQNPDEDLRCVFCGEDGETWDHLVGLVKNGELRGYGHQVGNLVPCCKTCNSKKGGKDMIEFIQESPRIKEENKVSLIDMLLSYQKEFAFEVSLENLASKSPNKYAEYQEIKKEIFNLMEKADIIADNLRDNVILK